MKVLKIDGRAAKVFVLKETEDSLVYIPVKSLALVDYERLLKMEDSGGELLKTMAKETLSNGRNALVQYDNIIQVARYTDVEQTRGIRVRRPTEHFSAANEVSLANAKVQTPEPTPTALPVAEVKQKNKPGPKPSTKPAQKRTRANT